MFQFVFIFGTAAVSLLAMEKLSGQKSDSTMTRLLELLIFGLLDVALLYLLLRSIKKLNIVHLAVGSSLEIGGVALAAAIPVALVVGLVAAVICKQFSVSVVEEKAQETHKQQD